MCTSGPQRCLSPANDGFVRRSKDNRWLYHRSRSSAAITNASIATCQATVSSSDLGNFKIYRLASSKVSSVLPSGKSMGRSSRSSQDTTSPRFENTRRRVTPRKAELIPPSCSRGSPIPDQSFPMMMLVGGTNVLSTLRLNAPIIPIRANIIGPPSAPTRIRNSMAA